MIRPAYRGKDVLDLFLLKKFTICTFVSFPLFTPSQQLQSERSFTGRSPCPLQNFRVLSIQELKRCRLNEEVSATRADVASFSLRSSVRVIERAFECLPLRAHLPLPELQPAKKPDSLHLLGHAPRDV